MSDSDLQYEVHSHDAATIVVVTGYLDAHTHSRMQKGLDEVFAAGTTHLAVDLAGVSYISSAGAGVFIWALEKTQEIGGRIALVRPSANVLDIFEMLGLTQIFHIADSRNAALDWLARPASPDEA